MDLAKRLPIGRLVALHALPEQEQVGPGDGFVVAPRSSVVGGEPPERRGEALERPDDAIAPEMDPREADMVGVMEISRSDGASFEGVEELEIRRVVDCSRRTHLCLRDDCTGARSTSLWACVAVSSSP